MFRGVGRVHQMILMLPSLSLFPLARAYSRDLTADVRGDGADGGSDVQLRRAHVVLHVIGQVVQQAV